jgi:hypothetical protein
VAHSIPPDARPVAVHPTAETPQHITSVALLISHGP